MLILCLSSLSFIIFSVIAQVPCLTHYGLFVHLRLVQTLNIACDSQNPHPLPPSCLILSNRVHVSPSGTPRDAV